MASTTWVKVAKFTYASKDGKYQLTRRNVFGGRTWQVFATKKGKTGEWSHDHATIVSENTLEKAIKAFCAWECAVS
jgi:fructose-1,6-bisphosphatase